MDLSGVYAKYQAAGTATVNYDDMEIIKVSPIMVMTTVMVQATLVVVSSKLNNSDC